VHLKVDCLIQDSSNDLYAPNFTDNTSKYIEAEYVALWRPGGTTPNINAQREIRGPNHGKPYPALPRDYFSIAGILKSAAKSGRRTRISSFIRPHRPGPGRTYVINATGATTGLLQSAFTNPDYISQYLYKGKICPGKLPICIRRSGDDRRRNRRGRLEKGADRQRHSSTSIPPGQGIASVSSSAFSMGGESLSNGVGFTNGQGCIPSPCGRIMEGLIPMRN